MKKILKGMLLALVLLFALLPAACSDKGGEETNEENTNGHTQHVWDEGTVTVQATYNKDGEKTYACSCGQTKKESIPSLTPTSKAVADGRKTVKNASKQSYDFDIKLEGNVNILGYSGSADGMYSGKYRYDESTGELKFYRKTGGKLLMDAQEYIYTQGSARLEVKADKNGKVKKVDIASNNNDELNMLNMPFVAIVNSLEEGNITSVTKVSGGTSKYRFKSTLQMESGFAPIQKLLNKIGSLGGNISFKNVTMTNPQNGVVLYFNMSDDGLLTEFAFDFDISVVVSGQTISLKVSYSQNESAADIVLPILSAEMNKTTISTWIGEINSAIDGVRDSDTYSLDMTAENNLDAGWNKSAVVDKYISRMYKNVNDGRTDFNHSYKYKAHTEEDGKESFAYTVGNIQDGSVYEISRKGTNTQTQLNGVTVNDRFDIHTFMARYTMNDVDFMEKKTNQDGSITYTLYTNNSSTTTVQSKIAELINSNTAEGAIEVDNHFNGSDYEITDADVTITVKNGKLVSFKTNIEMRYEPTSGEYVGSRVTLKNSVEVTVNTNLDKASEYSAPKNVETKIGSYGLNNSKYYIQ